MSPLVSMKQSADSSSDEEEIIQKEPLYNQSLAILANRFNKTAVLAATSTFLAAQIVTRFKKNSNQS